MVYKTEVANLPTSSFTFIHNRKDVTPFSAGGPPGPAARPIKSYRRAWTKACERAGQEN